MSEDTDFWDFDDEGPASRAFLGLVSALFWLIFLPFDLCLGHRTRRDDGDQGADWAGEADFIKHGEVP